MSDITILISTSPRPSHPSPRILDATIISARAQLPNAPIVIMADGCLCETDDWTRYMGFLDALRTVDPAPTPRFPGSHLSDRYTNTVVQTRSQIVQQSGMLKDALDIVKTPLILYLEDDWEFLSYPVIVWDKLTQLIQSGQLSYIRLYAQNRVHPLHESMMVDRVIWDGVPIIRTRQWSQNPHLSSKQFYQSVVLPICQGKCDYIENLLHGTCQAGSWEDWKMAIYNPLEGATTQTIRHLDGDQP